MSVSVERFGQGPDLVLLYGWGMNGAVWHGIAQNWLPTIGCIWWTCPALATAPASRGTTPCPGWQSRWRPYCRKMPSARLVPRWSGGESVGADHA